MRRVKPITVGNAGALVELLKWREVAFCLSIKRVGTVLCDRLDKSEGHSVSFEENFGFFSRLELFTLFYNITLGTFSPFPRYIYKVIK